MNNLDERDKKLIEEREKYEEAYYEQVIDEMIKEDALNKLIAERLDYIDESFDFEPSPAYEHLEEIYHYDFDRKIQEQTGDVDDYIDYPEGPDENLNGIISHEPVYEDPEPDYLDEKIEEQMKETALKEFMEENPEEIYNAVVDEAFLKYQDEQEKRMQELIKQHLKEEKEYLDNILIDVLVEEKYFEKAIDEIICDEIDVYYEEDLFDYENDEIPWYNSESYRQDESVIDPFDSLGDINYPEGEITRERIDLVFRDHFTNDDYLDKIVKRKLREKKFK